MPLLRIASLAGILPTSTSERPLWFLTSNTLCKRGLRMSPSINNTCSFSLAKDRARLVMVVVLPSLANGLVTEIQAGGWSPRLNSREVRRVR